MFVCFLLFFWFFCLILFYNCHYMVILLFLEVLLLGVYILLGGSFLSVFGLEGLFLFLLVMVCMGGFSISLLVFVVRSQGRDFWRLFFVF